MNKNWMRMALCTLFLSGGLAACKDDAKKAEPVAPGTDNKPAADAGQDPTKAEAPVEKEVVNTGPIARVNGKEISRDSYNTEIESLKKRFAMFGGNIPEAQLAKFRQRIIDRLVEDELIQQKLDAEKIEVPAADIDKELEDYKNRTPGGAERFEEFLTKTGKTVDELKLDIKKRLALQIYLNKDKALAITDEECTAYYEENKKRFTTKERVKAAHILVQLEKDADQAKQAEAKKKIDAIYAEAIKPGTDFEALATAKSEGPSAPRGGDLGWFTRGRMVKEFEDAAFTMKPGQVSKPLTTKFGLHVLKVYEREEEGEKKFEEVKEDIVKRLEARKFREARENFLKTLRETGKVEVLEKIVIPASAPSSAPGGINVSPGGLPIDIKKPIQINKIDVNSPTDGLAAPKKVTPVKITPAKPADAPTSN